MKRISCFVFALILLIGVIPIFGNASEKDFEIICFDDGSYLIAEVITMGTRASGSISGSKPYTYYNSNGSALWKATLSGSFTYTGSSATCKSSNVSVTIYDSSWYTVSKSASKSGNTATASVTMGKQSVGVTVLKVPISLTLQCDANGNLS